MKAFFPVETSLFPMALTRRTTDAPASPIIGPTLHSRYQKSNVHVDAF
jgi:hypothetical protein